MDDFRSKIEEARAWFPHEKDSPYVLIHVSEEHSQSWAETLGLTIRRCYISDDHLKNRAFMKDVKEEVVIKTKLPDPGSTMSGDFGELLVNLYQASQELPHKAIGFNKWRIKEDRKRPAPHSDVVHLVLPKWPIASIDDRLICSEVKTKATKGSSTPLANAIEDCEKDRTSRIGKTLLWLEEKAINNEEMDDVDIKQLNRFINAIDDPPATRHFRAILVICSTLLDAQLTKEAPTEKPDEYTVVVISVPELKNTYEAVFQAAQTAVTTNISDITVVS